METGHTNYDDPEPDDDKRGKALSFVLGALVVFVILYLLATGRVEIFN